ncbi:MAG: cytochrome c [Acidobacteriota bacterium]
MNRLKAAICFAFVVFAATACLNSSPKGFVIAGSKEYGASIFRQRCAICHGAEGHGKTLDNGTKVPSLREGEFKAVTRPQIYKQIADGGNGMVPFRDQLTDRELNLMAQFVYKDLRGQ